MAKGYASRARERGVRYADRIRHLFISPESVRSDDGRSVWVAEVYHGMIGGGNTYIGRITRLGHNQFGGRYSVDVQAEVDQAKPWRLVRVGTSEGGIAAAVAMVHRNYRALRASTPTAGE